MDLVKRFNDFKENRQAKSLTRRIRPVYHIHIRKTGGTTINFGFLSLSGRPDITVFYERMAEKENHRVISNRRVFVGWNSALIDEGRFSYAFSHVPLYKLNLDPRVFTFTCLRDPSERVISHYSMLLHYRDHSIDHPCMKNEGPWLGDSFDDFLDRIPREHLMAQLHMFSPNFDVEEASERIMKLDKVLYTEQLNNDLMELGSELSLKLPLSNQKTFNVRPEISDEQMLRLKGMLQDEYELLERLTAKR